MIHTQFNVKIKTFHADCACEYLSTTHEICHSVSWYSFPAVMPTDEQNGVVEHENRHILETARVVLISYSVPRTFWAKAILTTVNLINITLPSVLASKTPHERLYSCPPDYSMLRILGCTCYFLLPLTERTKLSARSAKCVLLGISSEHKGYRCYNPLTRRLLIFRHVSFVEDSCNTPFP